MIPDSCGTSLPQPGAQICVGFAGRVRFFEMVEEQPAQDGSPDATFEISVIQIVSQQVSKLLRDVLPLASIECENASPIRARGPTRRLIDRLTMPTQEVQNFNRIGVGK